MAPCKAISEKLGFSIDFLEVSAKDIPLNDQSVDTVVVTYTLCTIPEVEKALIDTRRVLRPGGELIFCEHGIFPDEGVHRWQNRLNLLNKRIGGGCNLNREIHSLLEKGSFQIRRLDSMYLPGLKVGIYSYWGTAREGSRGSDPASC